jgi:hypothetical protein
MEEPFKLQRSRIEFFPDGSGEVGYGTKDQFLGEILDLYEYEGDIKKIHDDLHENVWKARRDVAGVTRIRKDHFIKAINYSLKKDPTDGLNSLVESESVCEEEANSSSENDHSELKDCFKRNFIRDSVAGDIADRIVTNAWNNTKFSAGKAREKYIEQLSKNFSRGTWKQFIENTMKHCDKEHNLEMSPFFRDQNDAALFLDCMVSEIKEEKADIAESYWESCREEFYADWSLNDEKHLKELSEETEIPFEILSHCAQFQYDVLEKFRPIKENQTFLESFGAEIFEPSEQKPDE